MRLDQAAVASRAAARRDRRHAGHGAAAARGVRRGVARCVDGVTKIGRLRYHSSEARQAETFRKMLLAMIKDIRVILIKLADRTHNMRTLHALDEERQQRIALETREIYAPVALRLGMGKVRSELEDLAFSYLEPAGVRHDHCSDRVPAGIQRGVPGRHAEGARRGSCGRRGSRPACTAASSAPIRFTRSCSGRASPSTWCTTCWRCASSRTRRRTAMPRWGDPRTVAARAGPPSRTLWRCRA